MAENQNAGHGDDLSTPEPTDQVLIGSPAPHASGEDDAGVASVADSSADDPYEGAVPPGYDWPTHGGYLGCLMSSIAGALVGGFIGADLLSFLWAAGQLPGVLFVFSTFAVLIICIWLLGRVGWRIGRRFYRAYAQPAQPVWGEDDETLAATPTQPEV